MTTGIVCAILLILLLSLLFLGFPIAFSLFTVAMIGILWQSGPKPLFQFAQISASLGTDFILLTFPLFILMADLLAIGGYGDDAYTAASRWLNWLPGGLLVSSVFACAFFGALCGSSPVTAATIGRVAIPEMIKRGYDKKLVAGTVATAGTFGIMIPPSLSFIVYGMMTGTSVGKLFIAGILPGIMLSVITSLFIIFRVKMKPALASPPIAKDKTTWSERFRGLNKVGPAALLSFGIMCSIYLGVATPTEAAGIGSFGAFVLFLVAKNVNLRTLRNSLVQSCSVTSSIIILIIGGVCFSFFITSIGIPEQLIGQVIKAGMGRWEIMIIINIILLFLGCILDPTAILVLTLPIFFPLIQTLRFDPIWFGVIVTLNIEIGMLTPPVGLNLYVLNAVVPELKVSEIIAGSMPFLLILASGMVILMIFPEISLLLPGLMK